MTPLVDPVTTLAAAQKSAEVTDWPERIGWVVGLLLFVALLYWLMREGWKWRGQLQSWLPPLPEVPAEPGAVRLSMSGRYHGSTTAGQWLDRIVAQGLGARSGAELTLTEQGVVVERGARSFFIPAGQLRGARPERAIAGKVLPEGGLLVITWSHGGRDIDSGFRSHRVAEHPAWIAAINELTGDGAAAAATTAATAAITEDPSTKNTETEGAR